MANCFELWQILIVIALSTLWGFAVGARSALKIERRRRR